MPYVSRPIYKRVIAFAIACFSVLVAAHPATAAQTCSNQATSPVFAPFGDTAGYVPVQGGSFEANQSWKWSLADASLVAGNEPWYVNNTHDSQSMSIADGGRVVSPPVCVDATRPTWRFFTVAQSPLAALTVSLEYTDSLGIVQQLPVAALSGANFSAWGPTPVLSLGSLLPSSDATNVNLVFTAVGNWQIDDVYVDPYSR